MKIKKNIRTAIILVVAFCLLTPVGVYAGAPYKTWTRNYEYDMTETQSAYEPFEEITKIGGELSLKEPADMRLGPDNNLYIADTGNRRVIVSTLEGELVRVISSEEMKMPKGVFVTQNGEVYVADELAGKILIYSSEGELLRTIGKPTHPLFGIAAFKPQKLVVDKRGNLYIASTGNTNGIIQLSPNNGGEFLGYFGANKTRVNLLTIFRKTFFSEAQLSRLADVVPITISNLGIDEKGLIYTVSQGDDILTLKKLNMAGINVLDADWYDEYPAAVTTNDYGNIFMASKSGFIYEYNSEGQVIFIFGSQDDGRQRVGLFNTVSGIVADHQGRLYVLDSVKNSIQVFIPTEFADLVHDAFVKFEAGRYQESKEPWQEVIQMNSLFSYANIGLGEALFREGGFTEALQSFRLGGSYKGYSEAFWELRSEWLHKNMIYFIIGIAVFFVVWNVLKLLDRRFAVLAPVKGQLQRVGDVKLVNHIMFMFHNIKNPNDTAYGIRFEKKASVGSAFIVLLIFYILFVWEKYFSGFLFKRVPDGYFDLVGDAMWVLSIFFMVTFCCYLVCTITEGEAKFKDLFIGFIYALVPFIIIKPFVIVMSNVLTYNEAVFITFANVIAYTYTAILLILTIKNLNDYSVKETFRTIFLTAFTVAIITLVLFVIYILVSQVFEFVSTVFGEVVYRFGLL